MRSFDEIDSFSTPARLPTGSLFQIPATAGPGGADVALRCFVGARRCEVLLIYRLQGLTKLYLETSI